MKFNSLITNLVITLLASGACVHGQSRDVTRDENAEIRSNTRDSARHFRLRELTDPDLVALRRRGWLSDAWEGAKSEVNKLGHAIESGVKNVGDTIKSGVEKVGDTIQSGVEKIEDDLKAYVKQGPIGVRPEETYPYVLRDAGSSDSVDRRAFNPYKFSRGPLRLKKRDVTKRISFPYHSYPIWLRRSSDAAAKERDTAARRSSFVEPVGFIVGLGKGYNNGVLYRDLSLHDQSEEK